jgi:hypothetical protein
MEEIEGPIRGAAIGILLLIAAAIFRVRGRQAIGCVGILFVAGAIAYLFRGYPGIIEWPASTRLLLGVVALSCPFFSGLLPG